MPEPTATAQLQAAAAALHAFAVQTCGVRATQVWVADDLGFHPRAIVGRDIDDHDRDCARQCCLQGEAIAVGHVLAVPLVLTDSVSGACVFDWPTLPSPQQVQRITSQVQSVNADLDTALHSDRLSRLSGLARKSDMLRATLALAHGLEHCADLQSVIGLLHASLNTLMYSENFFVVVLDEERRHLHFEYSVDLFDSNTDPIEFHEGRLQGSLSAFVVAAGRVLRGSSSELLQQAGHHDRMAEQLYGPEAVDWLGVPMMVGKEAMGVLVVQSYDASVRFTDEDPSLLSMVADTMAAALHRRRLRQALERTVAERTAQLEQSNQALQQTVSALERAMSGLVQAEKLASLGSMVAGISHELNTPIGNALTVSSALQERFERMAVELESGKVSRSGLGEFVTGGTEMSALVVRATQRAVELITSFKQVAVDQTSAQRRNFGLHQVVDDILTALGSKLGRPDVHIHNAISADLVCDSYPGPLGQVVANLVQNALMHAFAETEGGNITITASARDGQLLITVSDDGTGMTPQVLARAFDPFFTTRLGQGGSGLGLAVCHRIVTSVLGGELSVTSSPGQGANFVLEFPAQAPNKL